MIKSNFFSFILHLFTFFSVYTDPFEKKVDHFLKTVRRRSKYDLEQLVQQDLVRLTIFLEYKFKGYKRLHKRYRKRLYKHADQIARDFNVFYAKERQSIIRRQKTLALSSVLRGDEGMTYLFGIMEYLQPGRKLHYQEAATFEKLLRDPSSEKLVGDCNQITTLYIYLFSLRFSVGELKVKILPNHICLHYKGIDIETTDSSMTHYDDYEYLSPVEEIVAANLLDISDPEEKQFEISPANLLKGAELAFHFSSHRVTVEKNLFIAYHNMALYCARHKNFAMATSFANKSANTKLQKEVIRMKAIDHLVAKRYRNALEGFMSIGDTVNEKACYQNELLDLFGKVRALKLVSDFKGFKSDLRRMKELALKVDNQKVVTFVNEVLKKLE